MSAGKKVKITNIGCGSVIANKYRISKIIGRGSFGIVYVGRNVNTNERIAVKFEKSTSMYRQLYHEYKVKNSFNFIDIFAFVYSIVFRRYINV